MQSHFELTKLILECCYDVAKELGIGFLEAIYKNALVIALNDRQVKIESEKVFEIFFRKKRVGLYIADLIVNDIVILS